MNSEGFFYVYFQGKGEEEREPLLFKCHNFRIVMKQINSTNIEIFCNGMDRKRVNVLPEVKIPSFKVPEVMQKYRFERIKLWMVEFHIESLLPRRVFRLLIDSKKILHSFECEFKYPKYE